MGFSFIKWMLLAAFCLSACQPQIATLPAPPTPEIWQVETTPALRWLGPVFQRCAEGLPGANLVLSERPAAQLGGEQVDFSFQWGDRTAVAGFTAVLGGDALAVVVNPANPLSALTPDEVVSIFGGKADVWNALIKAHCPNCIADFEGNVRPFVYATGEDTHAAAGWIPAGVSAVLAPGPAEVRAAVAKERYGVGYLPARWVDSSVKVVMITPAAPGLLDVPVLAFAASEPQGAKRAWLACVQAAIQ